MRLARTQHKHSYEVDAFASAFQPLSLYKSKASARELDGELRMAKFDLASEQDTRAVAELLGYRLAQVITLPLGPLLPYPSPQNAGQSDRHLHGACANDELRSNRSLQNRSYPVCVCCC